MPDYALKEGSKRVSPTDIGLKNQERVTAQKEVFGM